MFSTFSTTLSVITKKVGPLIGTNWSIKLNGAMNTISDIQTGTVIEADITGQYILAINQGDRLVYTTNDFGTTWVSRTSTHGLPSGTALAPSGCGVSGSGQYMYVAMASVAGVAGTIYKSSNYGVSWSRLSGIPGLDYYSLSVSSDGQSVLCTQCSAGTAALYLSTNGGATFNNIASNTSPGGADYWSSYSISPDGTKIVACGWVGKIVYSDNGGTSWTIIDNNPAGSSYGQIVVSNTGKCVLTIILGLANSVYVWNGTTWTGITVDMIPKDTTRICAASDDLSVILVSQTTASNNGYLYLSTDGGTTFKQLTAFGSSVYKAVGVSGDGKYIYCSGNNVNSKSSLYSSFN
jgi:hypothetical protein